jgi:MEMO1 family protein
MAAPLPRLRADLDVIPSPLPEQPGLVMRDPFRYSAVTLVVPPLLARCLHCFDGAQDEGDLRATLARLAGRVSVGEAARLLVKALHEAGFLEDQRFADLRAAREREFAELSERPAVHAGGAYPAEPAPLTETLRGYFDGLPSRGSPAAISRGSSAAASNIRGIVAPHVSPEGGRASYAQAYRALPADHADRIFVVLGTSHYGPPDRYGLTRKPFATPFGLARTEAGLVDGLTRAAPDAVTVDDYCHAVEHSIEFQVIFLQYLFGPAVRILPVLCGAFAAGPRARRRPEESDPIARFIGALGELAAREGRRLSFVLGVDFAHVGRRYGDPFAARAHRGPLAAVATRDRARLDRIVAGDAGGFWDLVCEPDAEPGSQPGTEPGSESGSEAGSQPGSESGSQPGNDDLKWCGASPIYTFLRALPEVRGRLLSYDQWNIDDTSVVSFGAVALQNEDAIAFPENERA